MNNDFCQLNIPPEHKSVFPSHTWIFSDYPVHQSECLKIESEKWEAVQAKIASTLTFKKALQVYYVKIEC